MSGAIPESLEKAFRPPEALGAPPLGKRAAASAALLVALLVLADFLFWNHRPGINLFLFFVALDVAIVIAYRARLTNRQAALLGLAALIAAAPLAENVTPWAFIVASGGSALLALGLSGQLRAFEEWAESFLRFGLMAPFRLASDAVVGASAAAGLRFGGRLVRLLSAWLVPLLLAAVFAALFVVANPVIELGLEAIRLEQLLEALRPARVFLWCVVAAFAWAFLRVRLANLPRLLEVQGPKLPRPDGVFFGGDAIRNALVLFNAMFAVQTVMDLMFLWGGVRLPEGLSYAAYAHRGAYPLIVTALLAAAFVLVAMRRNGPGDRSPLIRNLVYVFVAQNIWLVISSMLRLGLYVEEYGLSGMRLAAGIWMVLVAAGLALIATRIYFNRSNRWLITCNLVALTAVIWGLAWFDAPAFIARYNVEHSLEVSGRGQPLDLVYMRQLGRGAIPALDAYIAVVGSGGEEAVTLRQYLAGRVDGSTIDWREWGWRDQRLRDYLARVLPAATPGAMQ
jgi:hypothetical protein